MLFKLFQHDFVGLLVLACISAAESLTSISDDDDLAARHGYRQNGAGTTLNIREIVIGRCWEYQRVIGMQEGQLPPNVVDCGNAWTAFENAFAYKNPCNTPQNAFSNFIQIMTVSLPVDGTLFWSGLKDLAAAYSRRSGPRSLFSLERTLLGYTVNDLTFCGSTGGIDYDDCPAFDSCQNLVSAVFWKTASQAFARQSRGSVSVMLNGSDPRGAFRNDSIFSEDELPYLDKSAVHLVKIIVVHDLAGIVVDTCDRGTILILKYRITQRELNWSCEEDPKLAKLIQCTENPDIDRCSFGPGMHEHNWIYVVLALLAQLLITWDGLIRSGLYGV